MAYCPPAAPFNGPTVKKAVGAVLNYGFDLSPSCPNPNSPWNPPNGPTMIPWLAPGEEVIGLTVTSDGGTPTGTTDVTIVDTTISANSTGVPNSLLTAWISGGTAGTTYIISFAWTTNSTPVERQDVRALQLVVTAT